VSQVKDLGIEYTFLCTGQVHHKKFDKTIRHDLLKFSKYDYTYKLKCNSETLEKVPMYGRANKKNQIRQKDKSFSNLKRWESTLVSVL